MKPLKLILSLFATILIVGFTYAQDDADDTHTITITVPEIALVDVESAGSTGISLTFTHSAEAGSPLSDPTPDTSLWLNYSSIQSAADATRTVSVKINALFPGVDIKVAAAADAGGGDGTLGTAGAGTLTLTTSDQTLITGIGSCYTDTGSAKGHNLTYTMAGATSGVASYADFTSVTQSTVTVTYTLSDN